MTYDKNIYKTARLSAGLTQERAAEKLGISVESLKAYESYGRLPPSPVVDGMCIIYDTLYLAYQHNRIASGEIKVVPEVEELDLARAALKLINRVRQVDASRDGLMEIAEDGVIDEAERPVFEAIVAMLDELIQAAIELKLSRQRED